MPFGRKKKDPDVPRETENESKSGRGGLFGSRSKDKSPAQSSNPYATPSASQNPYAARSSNGNPYAAGPAGRDPYSASHASLTQPPTSSFGSLSLKSEGTAPPPYTHSAQTHTRRNEKSPAGRAASPRFQTQATPSYGAGYGGDSYGSSQQTRSNGYGGFTRTRSQDTLSTNAARSALFGAAPQRMQQQALEPPKTAGLAPQTQDTSYSNVANYGSDYMPGGYGNEGVSPDAQLKSEDEEVANIKQEVSALRDDGIASLERSLKIAHQAYDTSGQTFDRLEEQGKRLHDAKANLDAAHNHNIIAQSQLGELKVANRGMLVPHIASPFNKGARERAEDDLAVEKRRAERERRSATQSSKYDSQTRYQQVNRELSREVTPSPFKPSYARRSEYVVEDDEDYSQRGQEEKINDLTYALLDVATKLKMRGQATSIVLDKHAEVVGQLHETSNLVDDGLASNISGLGRFEKRH